MIYLFCGNKNRPKRTRAFKITRIKYIYNSNEEIISTNKVSKESNRMNLLNKTVKYILA